MINSSSGVLSAVLIKVFKQNPVEIEETYSLRIYNLSITNDKFRLYNIKEIKRFRYAKVVTLTFKLKR